MAAVFALIFIPALATAGVMVLSGALDARTIMALTVFLPMIAGVFYGTLRMAKHWEEETD